MTKTIVTVVGTRPEIIRLSAVIKRLDSIQSLKHILIHTGQNYDYELNQVFFMDLGLREPDYYLDAAEKSPLKTISSIICKLEDVLTKIKPDAFLVLGDTNSALSSIVAKKLKIPIFHCEAGNRSFDDNVPEETNRKIIDHLADYNLPYSELARQNLLREGIHPSKVFLTGSPMKEVIESIQDKIKKSNIIDRLNTKNKQYFLVSTHREENVSNFHSLKNIVETLNEISKVYNYKIVISAHPRLTSELKRFNLKLDSKIEVHKPFGFIDYINLQLNSFCVISDSGTISEESSILGFNAVNFRYSQERPEGFESGIIPLVGYEKNDVLRGIDYVLNRKKLPKVAHEYSEENFSLRVVNVIISKLINGPLK